MHRDVVHRHLAGIQMLLKMNDFSQIGRSGRGP